jgi:sulfide:quinone oxidoreductase
MGKTGLKAVDARRQVAVLADGRELSYDLFLGVPAIRAPRMLETSGLLEGGYVAVKPKTLETRFPDVYAVGDCAKQGTPKAGVFAEGAARAVAAAISARLRDQEVAMTHRGTGTCYIEYGGGRIGRVDIDFSDPENPTGVYHEPSVAMRADKDTFGASRRARWFGM